MTGMMIIVAVMIICNGDQRVGLMSRVRMVVMMLMIYGRIIGNPVMTVVIVGVGLVIIGIMMVPEKIIVMMINAVPMVSAA